MQANLSWNFQFLLAWRFPEIEKLKLKALLGARFELSLSLSFEKQKELMRHLVTRSLSSSFIIGSLAELKPNGLVQTIKSVDKGSIRLSSG